MRLKAMAAAVALAATQLTPVSALAAPRWIGSWAASPAPPLVVAPGGDARRASPVFENQTIVQVVRLSAGGDRVRVRLTNEYGAKPLVVGAARVALLGSDGAVMAGGDQPLTFAGAKTATLPPGAPLLSDPVSLKIPPLAKLRVSLYLPGATGPCTCHMSAQEFVGVGPGDLTVGPLPEARGPAQYRAFLSGVEVQTARTGRVIVAFGDSITEGYLSTPGRNARWPDRLAERLAERYGPRAPAVVNAGIGGNRVLSDGFVPFMGQSALSRFDRDVLAAPGVTDVVILEGVNDLGMGGRTGSAPTAEALIAGYRQLIERAHARGVRVIGATILPYAGAGYYTADGDKVRQAVNTWIRTGKAFDAVIDLDAAIRDPAKPERMRADWHAGDWLHPNDAGYRAMADAVDLGLFR